ncbi:MAG: transporter substrate-binding domain-containing protein [Eubacterium sp.]|nr:transporter substrate-binding domain-containing protein [Eubacterium sp.]
MKKFIAMLLCAVMCVSTLAGCGSSTGNEADSSEAQATEAVATESDWEEISAKGEMTIGMTLFAPMNYYDEDNNFVGFDTELANAVGEKLGIKINFIEINWDSKEIELNSKNIDCIWNGMCITEERKQNMSISEPYLYNTQAIVMKADREDEIMSDVSGLTVTAEQGSTGEGKIDGSIEDDETVEVSAKDYFANANYVASDSMAKALMEVKSGTADLAVVDSVCALAMVGPGTDYEDLVVNLDNNFGQQEYGIAFRKGSDLTEKVDEAINELYEEGKVDEIAAKYGLEDMLVK